MGFKQLNPLMLFRYFTTKSLLSLNDSALVLMKSWVPFNASTAAAWLIEEGFVVDEEWEMTDNSIELTVSRWV